MILSPQQIVSGMRNHIAAFHSSQFLCQANAAFESWFRVELFSVLCNLGFQPNQISVTYKYHIAPRMRADLLLDDGKQKNLFEIKSFVSQQDRNKRRLFPKQINRMVQEYRAGYVNQIVAFATFNGYGQRAMNNWNQTLARWLRNTNFRWRQVGPQTLMPPYSLQVWVACLP